MEDIDCPLPMQGYYWEKGDFKKVEIKVPEVKQEKYLDTMEDLREYSQTLEQERENSRSEYKALYSNYLNQVRIG